MNSPQQLKNKLKKQWQSADHREKRLLGDSQWPLTLNIGLPKAPDVNQNTTSILNNIKSWRVECIGQVEWKTVNYQGISEAVELPIKWHLKNPSEWVQATTHPLTVNEFEQLSQLVSQIDERFHRLFIRQKSLWCNDTKTMIQCCHLAMQLSPGMAQGKPLRALTFSECFIESEEVEQAKNKEAHIDSKFIENNRLLLIKLLNIRFNDQLKTLSLEAFLNAAENKDHWLLVVALDETKLNKNKLNINKFPFQQIRLRTSELAHINLPANRLIIVENEQCLHQLPDLEDCIAILGAGLNLSWLNNPHFNRKKIAYWGDIDSWGFKMLAIARKAQPNIQSLLMNHSIFKKYRNMTVVEPKPTVIDEPEHLKQIELDCFNDLKNILKNRLEQEFINRYDVIKSITRWSEYS
jgi:hypothetical protein